MLQGSSVWAPGCPAVDWGRTQKVFPRLPLAELQVSRKSIRQLRQVVHGFAEPTLIPGIGGLSNFFSVGRARDVHGAHLVVHQRHLDPEPVERFPVLLALLELLPPPPPPHRLQGPILQNYFCRN